MNYRRNNKMDTNAARLLLGVFLIVCLLYFIALSCAEVKAGTWVEISEFKGLATHTNGLNADMSVARGVDGWFVRSEGLSKPWFQKIRGNPVIASPTYILGHNASSDRVLLYSDNFFSMTNNTIDPVGYAQTDRADSAYTLSATDSVIYNLEDDSSSVKTRTASHWWLMWALTTRSSVVWNDSTIPVYGFYSNRWLLTRDGSQEVATEPMNLPISTPSVDEGSGTLDLPIDSTLIFDGSYIWVYSGAADSILNSSTTSFTMPTYADTGRVVNVWETDTGDTSLVIVIDPPNAFYDSTFEKYWILWDDSLLSSHATPCSVMSSTEFGTDSVRLFVLADSTKFKPDNHYWGRVEGSGNTHMQYLLYRPGAMTHFKTLGRANASLGGVPHKKDSLTHLGRTGQIRYARLRIHAKDEAAYNLNGLTTRTTDRNVWQITTDGTRDGTNEDTAFCMLTGFSSTSSDFGSAYRWFEFLIWDTDTLKASEWAPNMVSGLGAWQSMYHRPQIGDYNATTNPSGWAITTISTTTSNDRFATIHRQRAFASGNTHINSTTDKRDSTLWVRYTKVVGVNPAGDTTAGLNYGNYSAFPSANKFLLEGADPVTGLSSHGNYLGILRRRGGTLLSGFSASTFSTEPMSIGQGAANHWCIARSPLHNKDVITNENGLFFFSPAGLEPLSESIVELFSDSINWNAESKIRGTVYDNMYFVTAPFDTDTTNTDMIGLDLETRNAWLMTQPRLSSVWNFRDDDGSEEWYGGDADSTILWKLEGSASDLYFIPEWKSSWSDLGDPEQIKQVQTQRIEFDAATYTDTLYVDWYADLTDTVNYADTLQQYRVWTDTIPCNTNEGRFLAQYPTYVTYPTGLAAWAQARNLARALDVKRQTVYRSVPRKVSGKFLSFGLRGSSRSAVPLTVMKFGFEYQPLGVRRR